MNAITRKSRLLIAVGLLAVLSLGQLVYAQDSKGCPPVVPQWVLDRQQYETTYVYMPPAGNLESAENVRPIPQWVLDRQQYETTYVYVPPSSNLQPVVAAPRVPQWVLDRQQYETTYVYVPPAVDVDNHCPNIELVQR